MSSEFFKRTSLHLVRLKIFQWIKCLRRHLPQILENWAGRNFVTESRVNSQVITHARMHREMNLKCTTTNGFNFRIINTLMASWEVRLTWLNCNQRSYIWILGGHCVKMFGEPVHGRQSYFLTYMCLFNRQRKNKNIIYANLYRNTINNGDSQTSPLPIFHEGGGTSVHRLWPPLPIRVLLTFFFILLLFV